MQASSHSIRVAPVGDVKDVADVFHVAHVFTKCRMVRNEHRVIGYSLWADSIRHECEAGLWRLRVEAIDLYQINWPNPNEDIKEGGCPWPR